MSLPRLLILDLDPELSSFKLTLDELPFIIFIVPLCCEQFGVFGVLVPFPPFEMSLIMSLVMLFVMSLEMSYEMLTELSFKMSFVMTLEMSFKLFYVI